MLLFYTLKLYFGLLWPRADGQQYRSLVAFLCTPLFFSLVLQLLHIWSDFYEPTESLFVSDCILMELKLLRDASVTFSSRRSNKNPFS